MKAAEELITRRRCEDVDQPRCGSSNCTFEQLLKGVVNKCKKKRGAFAFVRGDGICRLFDEGRLDKLPLGLAEVALDVFNKRRLDVFYEDVNVIESLLLGLSVNNIITLHITFQASLPPNYKTDQVESAVIQTFATKISVSFPDPTLSTIEIGFHSVKKKEQEDLADYEQVEDLGDEELFTDFDDHPLLHDTLTGFGCGEYSKITGERIFKSDEKILSRSDEEILSNSGEKVLSKSGDEVLSKSDEKNLSQSENVKHSEEKRVRYYFHPGAYSKPLKQRKFKGSELSKELESFNKDLAESDGFDVGFYPLMDAAGIHGTWLYKFYDHENKALRHSSDMNRLVCYSRLAICVYNIEENTYFDNVKVLRAMTCAGSGSEYNITFKASLPDSTTKTFQTRIIASIPFPYAKIKIEFVRVKPFPICKD